MKRFLIFLTIWAGACMKQANTPVATWSNPRDNADLALALPLLSAGHVDEDYYILREFIEKNYPKWNVVFVNEDERLLNPGAVKSPIRAVPVTKAFKVRKMTIWLLPRKSA